MSGVPEGSDEGPGVLEGSDREPGVPEGPNEGPGAAAGAAADAGGPVAGPGDVQRLRYDCAVKGCLPSVFGVHSYHRLPNKDKRGRPDPRRELWIRACRLTDADHRSRIVICSKHFKASDDMKLNIKDICVAT